MEIKKKLVMTFKTSNGKNFSLSVDDPRENLTESEIKSAMTLVLSKGVFVVNGEELAALVDSKVVQTDTTEYDLVV
ncbi:DUF2922 domain-containing protein [Romboutsia sp. 1001216sp1]|uniref:DUF2922 domain-containing protein n=1 Tax=unclassified Romboutsia TaxID=2626894 RepID=UPI00189ECCFF|nr:MULTISPECIES: DUF2922 domain-containing protein [unclassified Romboutsia]MDB8802089.1 DUF2922 domain-containing protein [Romboutsia sp. 1001216sp1]MDB8813486.1 DUF2922 domain-containing protein [Romboutsia sp. 1001216sp1]